MQINWRSSGEQSSQKSFSPLFLNQMFNEVERYDEKIWCEKKESGISSANLQARFLSAAKATHYWIPDQVGDDKGYVGNGRERSLRAKKEIYRWFNLQD